MVTLENRSTSLSNRVGLNPCYSFDADPEITFDQTANGFRLPGEWEYACKAGSIGIRYGELKLIIWYKANSEKPTHNVGLKEPNAWVC